MCLSLALEINVQVWSRRLVISQGTEIHGASVVLLSYNCGLDPKMSCLSSSNPAAPHQGPGGSPVPHIWDVSSVLHPTPPLSRPPKELRWVCVSDY